MKVGEILRALKDHYGSAERLRRHLKVSERTIHTWLRKSEGELQRLQADHIELIKKAAREIGLAPEMFADGPKLWDEHLGYDTNLALELSLPAEPPTFRVHRTDFLGHSLNSPFGASASVLTSTPSRIRFLACTGCDLITVGTVRTRSFGVHPGPNILYCERDVPPLAPETKKHPAVLVGDDRGRFAPQFGTLNRFGIPSRPPDLWSAMFSSIKQELSHGQLLVLSVTGTCCEDDSRHDLVGDYVRAAKLAVDAGAEVIELNISCHNCAGKEDGLYLDLAGTMELCRAISKAGLNAKFMLKIGFMQGEPLRRFVMETAPYVHGYSAINTFPLIGLRQGQHSPEPAFGRAGVRGGISGPPLQRLALRTVSEVARLRSKEGCENLGLIGSGGVAAPKDVKALLDAGADVVQVTNALLADSYFGVKVRQYLDKELQHKELSSEQQREEARVLWSRAIQELQRDIGGGEQVARSITSAGIEVILEWDRRFVNTLSLGPRRALPVPSVQEFRDRIKERMRGIKR